MLHFSAFGSSSSALPTEPSILATRNLATSWEGTSLFFFFVIQKQQSSSLGLSFSYTSNLFQGSLASSVESSLETITHLHHFCHCSKNMVSFPYTTCFFVQVISKPSTTASFSGLPLRIALVS